MSDTATTADRTLGGQPFPAVGTYAIDVSHSSVQGIARHLMVSKVRASFTDFAGTITVGDTPAGSRVQVAIQADSIDSGDAKRDEHLRSGDFLDVERFPELTFHSTDVREDGTVTGDLTIRDTTRQVDLAVEYLGTIANPWGQTVAAFSATTKINREDFDITWNAPLEAGGVLVSKDVTIELEIQATLQS